ncbi:hypothetical protein ACB288_07115 [Aeromonas taiwanensis]|uniref:hypothetical protein n=1 Tax=Aeromonas sp. SrichE-2G TaxID=2823359 RepID=UPI001B320454|nr:hypothetical protein [Aeromonas sp. SrichE-2G]MBP4043186.1 hypothetical protein [Aeromonas sp. SrichE-2G]
MKNIILVVLYNRRILESETYCSLLNIFIKKEISEKKYEVLFWDNSPSHVNLDCIDVATGNLRKLGLKAAYFNCPDNKPLSQVYNKVIKDSIADKQYLFIFDQDTTFDCNYFKQFEKSTRDKEYNILLPVVRFRDKIVSPTKIFYIKGVYFHTSPKGEVAGCKISAINSGMALSLKFLAQHGFEYNEKLRNYCTDDDLMLFARSVEASVFVLDYELEHDLSFSTLNENSDSLRERYNEMVRAKKIIYSRNKIEKYVMCFYFSTHRLYMALKYFDVKYLKD